MQASRDSGLLKGYFHQFGRVRDVHLQKDKVTFASKNFAFITFAHSLDADKCGDLLYAAHFVVRL